MNKFKQPPRQKTILSIFLMSILLFTQGISVYASTATLPSGTTYTDIGTEIEKYVEENIETTAGMEVSIFHENDTIYQNYFGYADKENQIATDFRTRYSNCLFQLGHRIGCWNVYFYPARF